MNIKDDVLQYSIKHERKDRPNWSEMLTSIGLNFLPEEIDIFAYANNSNSYTATRSVAAYLKGITSAISKPLIVIDVTHKSKNNTDSFTIMQILFILQYHNIKK